MTKKELLEAIKLLFDDTRVEATIENSEDFDACYDVIKKTIEIKLYDDKRRFT